MQRKNKNKKKLAIASLIIAGALIIPTPAHAIGVSARASVSCRSSVSSCRPATVRSTTTVKSSSISSSRPTSLKSGTTTFRVARGGHAGGHGGHSSHASHSSHVSSHSSSHVTKSTTHSTKSTTKVDSGKFSTKRTSTTSKNTSKSAKVSKNTNTKTTKTINKKTTINVTKHYTVKPHRTVHIVNTHPVYYSHYPATPVIYNRGLGFWDYYMLGNLLKDKKEVTDRDIARELESRGYSQSEVDSILKEAKSEQKQVVVHKVEKKKSFWQIFWSIVWTLVKIILVIIAVLLVGIAIATLLV